MKFVQHASINCHKEAVLKMVSLTTNVAELLSVTLAQEKLQCFLKIYTINFNYSDQMGCGYECGGVWFKGLSTFQMLPTPL